MIDAIGCISPDSDTFSFDGPGYFQVNISKRFLLDDAVRTIEITLE